MKFTNTLILLALSVLGTSAQDDDLSIAFVDCKDCIARYDFCNKNGHTRGEEGCMQTCREHVCHQTRECRPCSDELKLCPEKSRYQ